MLMVAYQTPRMAYPMEALAGMGKYLQPRQMIGIIKENRLAPLTTRGHVIQPAGQFNSEWSCHKERLT